jgi:NAD(P)-dependent dehydrogenase (short-subunit alcohol dehydrogenase family)
MQLAGKIALVTGAGRGIGRAIAIGFAGSGADIVAVSRTLREIEETVRAVKSAGRRGLAIQADVSRLEDVEGIAQRVRNEFGRLDILVNNAALRMNYLGTKDSYYIPFVNLTVDDWDAAIKVNLRGPFLCVRELLPLLRRNGTGSIINISAGAAKRGMAGRVPYCASKFGLEGLTQSLAPEFQPFNIAVNALSPGKHSILTDEAKREQLQHTSNTLFMRPEIMVPAATFLALQDGRGITGQHIEALAWVTQNGHGGIEEWKAKV